MRVLLVEDNTAIATAIKSALAQTMQVDWFMDAESADAALQVAEYEIVLLDLSLPKQDGMSLLADWRRRGVTTPVLILTARDAIANRVAGLNAGADDYMVKPFDLDELQARMHALIRRSQGRAQPMLMHQGRCYDVTTGQMTWQDKSIELSAKERMLVEILMGQPNRWFSRADLEDKLYGWDQEVESNAIEVHIHHLRKKLGTTWIKTKRGVGYRLGDE